LSEIERKIQSITRAIQSEEKQGYLNTGAIGSFSDYISEALSDLHRAFSAESIAVLNRMIEDYHQSSPKQRRVLLVELKEAFAGCVTHLQKTIPVNQEDKDSQPRKTAQSRQPLQKSKEIGGDLQYIKGVGPYRAKQFAHLGVHSVEDLFRHYPRRYELRIKRKIEDLQDGELATITGIVQGSQISRGRIQVVKLNIQQEDRYIHATWFNQIHIPKQFPLGTKVSVTGKVQWKKRIPEILVSEIVNGENEGPAEEIIPVYPETAQLHSKFMRAVIKTVLKQSENIFPEVLAENTELMERAHAYQQIHFPSSFESMGKARARLVVEEILFLQVALTRLRSSNQIEKSPIMNSGTALVRKFISSLSFKLTAAQKRVIGEIFQDMDKGKKAMTRLLQGDVGSGKTAVAMSAILQAVGSGYQAAMMAPTEVLALQHYESLRAAFEPLGLQVVLLIGSQSKAERDKILSQIVSGKTQVVVGTHALIQESVHFHSLGLVVTDEQHRFGVRQRTQLEDKGENPHVLVMTATPIPRTLALTLYGDLQLSILDEMPIGRRPIITKKISERNRPSLEKFLEQQMLAGRQIYVVCPLVEETEKSDLVSATQTYEILKERFPDRTVALLHGRMKSQEKERIMQSFREAEIDILIATTVVEVGINVPNASVMVVEGAERFGLAQLHQLRGRVGRGNEQSYCILISNVRDNMRLNTLCETEDGFKIAEEDLKIRGPGELLGLRQHGIPELKLTDLSRDGLYVEKAYQILQSVLADPQRYAKLYQEVERLYPKDKVGVN